jgi:TRAP-type C4-dicarboxylate transport system permease large subunit
MLGWLLLLLVVWVALMVLGAVIEGLFWLVVIGAVLFAATALFGWVKRDRGTHV